MVTATSALSPSPLRLCYRKLARPHTTRGGAAAFSGGTPRCHPASSSSALLRSGLSSYCSRSKRTLHSATASTESKAAGGGNRRARVALGAVTTLAAVAALARESQLPDSFSEWDDEVIGVGGEHHIPVHTAQARGRKCRLLVHRRRRCKLHLPVLKRREERKTQ